MGKFKGIIKLSKTNLERIRDGETVIIGGKSYSLQEDTLYVSNLCVDIPTSTNELTNNGAPGSQTVDPYATVSQIPSVPSIVDALDSTSTTSTLSAKQGKVLNDNKLEKKPNGTNNLIDENNKIDTIYLPDVILGQLLYGGDVGANALATLTNKAKKRLKTQSDTITLTNDTTPITGYVDNEGIFYIASTSFAFGGISFDTGDWLLSNGSSWRKIDNSDAVTGVKGNEESTYRTGNVNITCENIGAEPTISKNTAFNKNFETSTSNIKMNGTASVGSESTIARSDHVHPSDTSKVSKSQTIAGVDLQDNITKAELLTALDVEDGAQANVQSDWNESDNTKDDYIKNKPTLGTASSKDVATGGVGDNNGNLPTTAQVKTYVDTNGGKIDVIKKNGTTQTIVNKEVDFTAYDVAHGKKTSVNLNTLTTPGNYGIDSTCTNKPVEQNGTLFVGEWNNGTYVVQLFIGANNTMYVRNSTSLNNSTWSEWKETLTSHQSLENYVQKSHSGGLLGGTGTEAYLGGAAGNGAIAGNGFSGGKDAKVGLTGGSVGTYIDAIQLGEGTNNNAKTMQVYDFPIMNANGQLYTNKGQVGGTLDMQQVATINDVIAGEVTIEDNLTSTSATSALSANQGRVLDGKITTLATTTANNLNSHNTSDSAHDYASQKINSINNTIYKDETSVNELRLLNVGKQKTDLIEWYVENNVLYFKSLEAHSGSSIYSETINLYLAKTFSIADSQSNAYTGKVFQNTTGIVGSPIIILNCTNNGYYNFPQNGAAFNTGGNSAFLISVRINSYLSNTNWNTMQFSVVNGTQPATFPTVNFNDIVYKNDMPTTLSSFTDDLGSSPTHTHSQYLTGITSSDVTNALGYTPLQNHQDISGKQDVIQHVTIYGNSGTLTEEQKSILSASDENYIVWTGAFSVTGDKYIFKYANDGNNNYRKYIWHNDNSEKIISVRILSLLSATWTLTTSNLVKTTRTINGKALSSDITLTTSDLTNDSGYITSSDIVGKQDSTDNSLTTTDKTIVGAINEVSNKVNGMVFTKTYNSIQEMVTALNSMSATEMKVGNNIYIVSESPDLWIGKIEESSSTYTYTTDTAFINALTNSLSTTVQVGYYRLLKLETEKVDLTDYVKKTTTIAGVDLQDNITASELKTALSLGNVENKSSATIRGELTSSNVTTALGFTPYNSTNPNNYISGIDSTMVTTALGYTPYDSTNPKGFLTKTKEMNPKVSFSPYSWSTKTWNGLTNFRGDYVWTDGKNIYYSGNSSSSQYVLNRATSTWETKTWNLAWSFSGYRMWTDGKNIYYSYLTTQGVLDTQTGTWSTKTWNGLTNFNGENVWTDGDNIYYSSGASQYVLDKTTSTWSAKTWNGLTNFNGSCVWTDGDNIYYSAYSELRVLDKSTSTWVLKGGSSFIYGEYIWTDGCDFYSKGMMSGSYVFDKSTLTWNTKTWSGLTYPNGQFIWTDGIDTYYSNGATQYVLDKLNNSHDIDKTNAIISRIPEKTSQLTNDSGFLTSHQDISGKLTGTKFGSAPYNTFIPYSESYGQNTSPNYVLTFRNNNGADGLTYSSAQSIFQNSNANFFANGENGSGSCSPSQATKNGFYYVSSSTSSLSGADSNPFLQYHSEADFQILTNSYGDSSYYWLQQIATDFRSPYIYYRRKQNGTWSDWRLIDTEATHRIRYDSTNKCIKFVF